MNNINKRVLFFSLLGILFGAVLSYLLSWDIVAIFLTGYFWNLILIDDRIYLKVEERKYRFSLLKGYVVINDFLMNHVVKGDHRRKVLLPLIVFGPFLLFIEQYLLILMLVLGALAFEASAYLKNR